MTLDEAMTLLETRLRLKDEKWEINLHRNIGGNWTATLIRPYNNQRIYGFDGIGTGQAFRRGPAAAIENLLDIWREYHEST